MRPANANRVTIVCLATKAARVSNLESKFPHHVEMIVPEGGFGRRLNEMHDSRGSRSDRRENGRDIIRGCFAYSEMAALFRNDFGSC
jgi:hypothetical protein